MLGALAGYCLQVALPHDQVCAPLHFDLVLVFRIEKHPVADLHGADVVADPKNHTRDLGGTAMTTQVGDAVCAKLAQND